MTELHKIRQASASLNPLDYVATVALLAIYGIGTSLDEVPGTSLDFYRSAATVIPTLLVAVAIQGRVLELSSKLSLAHVLADAVERVTIAREKTNWAAHLYVYLALLSLGLLLLYLALVGPDRFTSDGRSGEEEDQD